jgi:hypothetical protein
MSGLVGVYPAALAPTVEELDFNVAAEFFRNNLRRVVAISLSVLIHRNCHAFDARPFHAVENVHMGQWTAHIVGPHKELGHG